MFFFYLLFNSWKPFTVRVLQHYDVQASSHSFHSVEVGILLLNRLDIRHLRLLL